MLFGTGAFYEDEQQARKKKQRGIRETLVELFCPTLGFIHEERCQVNSTLQGLLHTVHPFSWCSSNCPRLNSLLGHLRSREWILSGHLTPRSLRSVPSVAEE